MKKIAINGIYRHFKGGLAIVLTVAKHSETGEMMVIYKCLNSSDPNHHDRIYARPADMFLSKVDKEKYPDVKQEYRFELEGTIDGLPKIY